MSRLRYIIPLETALTGADQMRQGSSLPFTLLPYIILAATLTGCVERQPEHTPQEVKAASLAKCKEYGFKQGSEGFADCRMKLEAEYYQAVREKDKATQDYINRVGQNIGDDWRVNKVQVVR